MTLAHGTDRLDSAPLGLRRVVPGPRSPEATAKWLQYTLASYEQLGLGYLAVVRREDGALIGRCGLMDLVVESAAPEQGIRKGWFGREGAPDGIALTSECEFGLTWDRWVWTLHDARTGH